MVGLLARVLIGSFCGVWLGLAIPMAVMTLSSQLADGDGSLVLLLGFPAFLVAYMPSLLLHSVGIELPPSVAINCGLSFIWWWTIGTVYGVGINLLLFLRGDRPAHAGYALYEEEAP